MSTATSKRSWPDGYATSPPTDPRAAAVDFDATHLKVRFRDGRELRTPLEWFPLLRDASQAELRRFTIGAAGRVIHWPTLDEDIAVAGLLGMRE